MVQYEERPVFVATTAGKAAMGGLFGAIGGAVAGGAMVSAGQKIAQDNNLQDPAPKIAEGIVTDLAVFNDLTIHDSHGVLAKSADPAALAKTYPGNDLILDVRTTGWSFGYFPTNWTHYRVFYTVTLRLIRTSDSKVLAEGACVRGTEQSSDGAPTYDELLADSATLLKRRISDESQDCAKELKNKVLVL
jgi:hypothetical protein